MGLPLIFSGGEGQIENDFIFSFQWERLLEFIKKYPAENPILSMGLYGQN